MFITMLFTATYNDGKNTQIVLSLSRVNNFFLSDAREGKTYMIIFSDSSKLFYNHKCVFVCKQLWATYIDVIELLHSLWTVELLEIFGSSAECRVNGT